MPAAWDTLCAAQAGDTEEIDPDDPTVLQWIDIEKESGAPLTLLKQVCSAVGPEREAWRVAMQAEVDSLKDNNTFESVGSAELKRIRPGDILPMKLVAGVERGPTSQTYKHEVRAVVCGRRFGSWGGGRWRVA